MFLRETRRTNRDGSVVSYLQLAHNERHPVSGNPVAKVIHSFGRADTVDRAALARLVSSISRFLTPEQAVIATPRHRTGDRRRGRGAGLPPVGRGMDAGPDLGTPRDRRGDPPGRGRAAPGRRAVERVVFALVCQRACEPGSKLAATGWVAQRVAMAGCPGFADDAAYAAMDFLLDALPEIAAEIFSAVAHLLNLDLDLVFVDTTCQVPELGHGADQRFQAAASYSLIKPPRIGRRDPAADRLTDRRVRARRT